MNIKRITTMFLLCAGFALASSALAWSENPTPLTLINGWFTAPDGNSKAEVENIDGIVHFKGAIATNGTSEVPFVLPKEFRPAHHVYLSLDLCNATHGQLYIEPNGQAWVSAETVLSNATCFTSLDGASFALNSTGFTKLKLINGWTTSPDDTRSPEAKKIDGIVHLAGAISTNGQSPQPFVLPKEFRPDVYVNAPILLCDATFGQLDISPSGEVWVEEENNSWSDAQCLTSLDGVSFAANDNGFKSLTLLNGWMSDAANPAVGISQGVVSFQGAIYTSGNSAEPFVLPASYRPATDVYVPVALCNDTYGIANGRLLIQPSGVVTVQAENGFSEAQCLTSLDGASFIK
jgi:hypothetical protein